MKQNITIKDLQPDLRPDEKFRKFGPKALSDAELLAIILRTGSNECHSVDLSRQILTSPSCSEENILNIFNYEMVSLMKIKGIGVVKATQIMAVAELSLRIANNSLRSKLNFNSPASIAAYYTEQLRHRPREAIMLIMLDSACGLIKDMIISEGTVNTALLSPREVFIEALKYEAVNIILLHNHPSGHPVPSKDDINSTRQILAGGRMIGIELLDHIIIGDRKYISFKEEGLINE